MSARDGAHKIEIEAEDAQTEPILLLTPRRTDFKPGFSHFYMHVRGDFLQRSTVERKVYKLNPWLILFSHEPLSAVLTLLPVQIVFIVVGMLWIIFESKSLRHIESTGHFSLSVEQGKIVSEFLFQDYLPKSHLACTWELSLHIGASLMISGFLAIRNKFHRSKLVDPSVRLSFCQVTHVCRS